MVWPITKGRPTTRPFNLTDPPATRQRSHLRLIRLLMASRREVYPVRPDLLESWAQAPQSRQSKLRARRPLTSLSPTPPQPGQSSPNSCHPERSRGTLRVAVGKAAPRVPHVSRLSRHGIPCSGVIRIVLAISINSFSSSDTGVPR